MTANSCRVGPQGDGVAIRRFGVRFTKEEAQDVAVHLALSAFPSAKAAAAAIAKANKRDLVVEPEK